MTIRLTRIRDDAPPSGPPRPRKRSTTLPSGKPSTLLTVLGTFIMVAIVVVMCAYIATHR